MPAISLFAFLKEEAAFAYLSNTCMCNDTSRDALRQMLQAAKRQIGPAMPKAGKPAIQSLEALPQYHGHIQQVASDPHFAQHFNGKALDFAIVEVDPLLAFQPHVLLDRAKRHCASLGQNPSTEQMLPICLPTTYPQPTYVTHLLKGRGALIEAPDGDVVVVGEGPVAPDPNFYLTVMGIAYMPPAPWVIVKQFGSRFYLANGYHRAYGLRQLGARFIPCLVVRAPTIEDVGIRSDGSTIDHSTLVSSNPPTCGHFANNRAFPVQVRRLRKFISVNWGEYVVSAEEDWNPPTGTVGGP